MSSQSIDEEEPLPTAAHRVNADSTTASSDSLLTNVASSHVRDGDYAVLVFADGRQMFVHCALKPKGKTSLLKINKRTYLTASLVGIPYGTVLELTSSNSGLVALPDGSGLLPDFVAPEETSRNDDASADDTTFPPVLDNRHIVDDNKSQGLNYQDLQSLKESGTEGSAIVSAIVQNSSTFGTKTEFSKAKYVARKQMKYQLRARLVRCTSATVCQAMFLKDPRRLMNMRDDTLAQILSYSNAAAGCQALLFEESGIITGALAQRMGGYGRILTLYQGQQPGWADLLAKFNLSFPEQASIKFVHAGDVFGDDNDPDELDEVKMERDAIEWPCLLQPHTRNYLKTIESKRDRNNFLAKRCARFARKLTRDSPLEALGLLTSRQCDSIILATRNYDPTTALLRLMRFLAPSCPFVVYSEFIEPLTLCFQKLQEKGLAINIRLSDTWAREYQVLPGRTHPNMTMSQSGGFILTGIKLDPETGRNELDEDLLKEIRAEIGGRRGKKKTSELPALSPSGATNGDRSGSASIAAPANKRLRT